jgi:hypothetical protein
MGLHGRIVGNVGTLPLFSIEYKKMFHYDGKGRNLRIRLSYPHHRNPSLFFPLFS